MTEVVHTNTSPDLMYGTDLASEIHAAHDAAYDIAKSSGNDAAYFFVQDQDGRGAQSVKVVEDVLTDGSKAYTIVITFEH